MMSGVCVDQEVRLDAEKLGAQDVLQKPFTPDQLRSCVTRLLDKKPDR
jgi:DNA-binding response OmpR family regulator